MSDYKRFISYVYEYRGGQKQENRGFVKVEARNGQCQMDFILKGMCQDGCGTCQLYAFRRNGTLLEGSLLYSGSIQDGMLNYRLQTPCAAIGESAYSMEEIAGLLMVCDQNQIYATQWDDDPMNFEGFPNTVQSNIPETDETMPNTAPQDQSDEDTTLPEAQTDEIIDGSHSDTPTMDTEGGSVPDTPPEATASDTDADVQATSAAAAASNCFRDGSIINCVKITPQDIQKLDTRDWHLKNNQFVHYGYQAFGHLLVGQMADSGQTVLCVPGSYHQRECFMANMFCFPHFKQCPGRPDPHRCFGYWYRSIHPANLGSEDCGS